MASKYQDSSDEYELPSGEDNFSESDEYTSSIEGEYSAKSDREDKSDSEGGIGEGDGGDPKKDEEDPKKEESGKKEVEGEEDEDAQLEEILIREGILKGKAKPAKPVNAEVRRAGSVGRASPARRRVVKRRRRVRISRVTMPTGKTAVLPLPVQMSSGWTCGDKTRMETLSRDGAGHREFSIIQKEMEKTRKTHTTGSYSGYLITKIQRIINPCLWRKYRNRRRVIIDEIGEPNDHMLFHGSTAIEDIVQTGFDERYSNTKGMFGAGVYFAENSSKSNQYVYGVKGGNGCAEHHDKNCFICERQLLLCRVTLGKVKTYNVKPDLSRPPPSYHSVQGVPSRFLLKYSENVVYRGEQAYPEFLITYLLVK